MKENLAINDDISSNPDEVNDHIVQFFTQLFIENEKLVRRKQFGWGELSRKGRYSKWLKSLMGIRRLVQMVFLWLSSSLVGMLSKML